MSSRSAFCVLLAAAVVCATSAARAATPDECIASHAEGQRLRREGRLLAAHDQFSACLADTCPAIIRKDCSAFDDEVRAQTPSVVFALSDANGKDVRDASVTVDDAVTSTALDGRDVALDPGSHRFTFTTASGRTTTVTSVVLREGEKLRRVVASLPPDEAPATSSSYLPVPTLAYVFGGVGVAGLGSFTYFAISGKAKQDDLEHGCAPRCSQTQVDAMRTRYLIGDISLAVGVVALGVGTYFFFADPFGERKAHDRRERQSGVSLRWAVAGAPGLAVASVTGDF
ncbi:MAG TPA: hypothetical protein VHU80_17460 [Polyangiaceae bacterium]|nr:hypothetical protein [Polyangiaceae bacterium]